MMVMLDAPCGLSRVGYATSLSGRSTSSPLMTVGAGGGQGEQVWCVHRPPPILHGLDEPERHGQAGGSAADALE